MESSCLHPEMPIFNSIFTACKPVLNQAVYGYRRCSGLVGRAGWLRIRIRWGYRFRVWFGATTSR